MRSALWFLAGLVCAVGDAVWAAETLPLPEVGKPGRILLLRHANAPGTGDPPNFRLEECSTQRNLDEVGRAQALELGRRLLQAGVKQARVYSSRPCKTSVTRTGW